MGKVNIKNLASKVEELKERIRQERNEKIKDTDWTQLPDVSESFKLAYQEYRQVLRDIPQQEGYPENVVWPDKPE